MHTPTHVHSPPHVPRPASRHRGLRRCRTSRAPHDDTSALHPLRARRAPTSGSSSPPTSATRTPASPTSRPSRRFAEWCERRGLALDQVEPMVVAAYVEQLSGALAPASVKQHLAALRMLFDWLVVGQVLPFNPASSVRGPKHVVKTGKTPVLSAKETRALLDGIDSLRPSVGLRDRRAPRRARLQLRARERRGLASRRRLLHPGPALVLPPPREGRTLQRRPRPPHSASVRRRLPRGRPHRRSTAAAPCSGAASPGAAMRSRTRRCRALSALKMIKRRARKVGLPAEDLRPQLPRHGDHRVPSKRRRPRGRGPDRLGTSPLAPRSSTTG